MRFSFYKEQDIISRRFLDDAVVCHLQSSIIPLQFWSALSQPIPFTIVSNRTVIMYCVRRIFGMTGRPRGAILENNMVWDKNKLITYVEENTVCFAITEVDLKSQGPLEAVSSVHSNNGCF